MGFISKWAGGDSVGIDLAILSLAVTGGLLLGAIRFRGIRLGISGVLFSALVFGQLGLTIDPTALHFLRDFALILFMYAIGLEVGPAFISSLRSEGLRLNVLAVTVLVLGALMTVGVGKISNRLAVPGLYAGAFTTTPGLAAAQDALRRTPLAGTNAIVLTGTAYTIAYPFGVFGPLLVIPLLRRIFGVRLEDEKLALAAAEDKRRPPITTTDFVVTQSAQAGTRLVDHRLIREHRILLTRLRRGDSVVVPTADTEFQVGDIYRAVGPRDGLSQLIEATGTATTTADFGGVDGPLQRMELIVTRTPVLHRTLRQLDLIRRAGVTIVRINRAGIELTPKPGLKLAFADRVTVVGPKAGFVTVENELGNCAETLNRPRLIPIFLGIVVGVVVGALPITFPGLNTTLRIGLAGGPLLAAIALSQFGSIKSIVWYMPVSSSQLFRDFGLAVFLACVGLQSGDHFIQNAARGSGVTLLLWGAAVTMIPVFAVACFARLVLRMNFITLSGWVAGAMGSTPALLFAAETTGSDAPAVAYAAVAPVATLVPILCAQLLVVTIS